MYAVGQNEAPRLPARVRVNGASDAVLWLDAARAARPLPSPATAPTVAEGAAGDLTGAYRWLVAFGSTVMVSYPSPVSDLLTVTAKRVNLSVVPTSTDGRVTKRRIYRTLAGGSVYKLVGEIADNVTADFEDNVADGALTDEYLAVTVFADGDPTDEYADRGRYVNHASQTTAAKRPLFKVGILNGRPVVRFDGTDDYLLIGNSFNLKDGFMGLFVYNLGDTANRGIFGKDVGDIVCQPNGGPNQGLVMSESGVATIFLEGATSPTDFQVSGWSYDGIDSAKGYRNGSQIATGTYAVANLDNTTNLYMGAYFAASAFFLGDLSEVIVFNRVLPGAEFRRVNGYLGRKYAIALAG